MAPGDVMTRARERLEFSRTIVDGIVALLAIPGRASTILKWPGLLRSWQKGPSFRRARH
jgi:hypothetical protein